MKKITCSLFLCFVLLAGAAAAIDDWTQHFPDPHPATRGKHAMAYIGGDQVLLFGGLDNDHVYGDTWLYDLSDNTWTQRFPDPRPLSRTYLDMAYLGEDKVLMFGGYDGTLDDITWLYDLSENTWTDMAPAIKPTGRYGQAMAYIGEDKVLMHSGYTYAGGTGHYLDDLWVYDLSDNNWTELSPSIRPDYRVYHKMAYIGGDQVLLFGGWHVHDLYLNDTWIFDLSAGTWTELDPITRPSIRHWYAMASIGGDRVLMFGGNDPDPGLKNDTWVFDLSENTWTEQSSSSNPSPRREVVMADMGGDKVLLFGGRDDNETPTTYYDDTWIWSATPTLIEVSSAPRVPEDFAFHQNYPNPFNPVTEIAYDIPNTVHVTLKIYNILGAEVATLVDDNQQAGFYTVRWDAEDLPSGVYFCAIRAGDFKATKKTVLLK